MVAILGLNASPRKYGETFKLLRASIEGAKMLGAKVEIIHLYDYEIKPCMGCLCDKQESCKYPCVIEDDMKVLYDKVLKADGVIFATPVYWFSPSAVLKNFIDRLTALENMIVIEGRSWLEGKVAGLIAVGNDSGVIQTISTLMSALVSMGFMIPPFAMAYFNRMGSVLSEDECIRDAVNVGRNVAMLAKIVGKAEWYMKLKESQVNCIKEKIAKESSDVAKREIPLREKFIGRAF